MNEFSFRTRLDFLDRLKRESFDLLVIGGGITGAGIAYDAAQRGLKTALIEKEDFSSGTSSKSSKLVHGGLRYLKEFQFPVTYEMLKERGLLQKQAPGLVRWIPFVVPFYPWTPSFTMSLGLLLYSGFAYAARAGNYPEIDRSSLLNMVPSLQPSGLAKAKYYWDCTTDDSRLVITVMKAAARAGAVIVNYAPCTGFLKQGGQICGAVLTDSLTGKDIEVKASCCVNATGAWSDQIRSYDQSSPPRLVQSKGIHIVVPSSRLPLQAAVLFHCRRDGRVLFAIPIDPVIILGTTDTFYEGSLEEVRPLKQEAEYILDAANDTFRMTLSLNDLISSFAGIRPLLKQQKSSASEISRKHEIYESPSGLISIAGGKLTTFRHMGKEVVDRICRRLRKPIPCATHHLSLLEPASNGVEDPAHRRLLAVYGEDGRQILENAKSDPSMGRYIVEGLPYLFSEVDYVVRKEMALTLSDVLSRRLRVVWQDKKNGLGSALEVARRMGSILGWSEEEILKQMADYQKEVNIHRLI